MGMACNNQQPKTSHSNAFGLLAVKLHGGYSGLVGGGIGLTLAQAGANLNLPALESNFAHMKGAFSRQLSALLHPFRAELIEGSRDVTVGELNAIR